jgi:two-component system heavy metal sensor histidine kinase CusS
VKDWSLRAKLTGWSALVVGVVLIACGTGAALFIEHEQIEALDDQLNNEAEVFFGELRARQGPFDWKQQNRVKELVPTTRTERFVEITDEKNSLLYRSANLNGHELSDFPAGMHTVKIRKSRTRLGVFREDGLILRLAVDLSEIREDTRDLAFGFLICLPLLLAIVILGGWWIARKALAPIQQITSAAEQITAEHLSRRLDAPRSRDEIGRLAAVLNAMLDRLDVSFRQAVRFSADASHELKTPLTILRAGIEDLLDSPELSEGNRQAVADLLEETHRLSSITESLLLLSRADAGRLHLDFAPANVTEILLACVEDARIIAEPHGISIETDLPEKLHGVVDARRLEQIILNLLDNAVKYNHEKGRMKISGAEIRKGGLSIFVGNTGPGIPKEHAPHLFERFFRSDATIKAPGHGLGLSLARELARAHGGDLILTRSDCEWTEFNLFIRARS